MLERRNMLGKQEISELGKRAQEHLISSHEFKSAKVVAAYCALGSEVKTDLIITQARMLGKKITLPRIEGKNMTFYALSSTEGLVKGKLGAMEPLPKVPVQRIDMLVVPGIAFDKMGYRLGYGKGYYDKFLANEKAFSIGLAYSFQVLEHLPSEEHDQELDAISTEEGIIYF